MKVKKTQGFTLVEVIVVLVILAILAVILVPKLTGWIDESKNKAAVGEGHLVLSAAQTAATQAYALAASNNDAAGSVKIYTNSAKVNAQLFKDLCGEDVNMETWNLKGGKGEGSQGEIADTFGLFSYSPAGKNLNAKPSLWLAGIWAKKTAVQPFAYLAFNDVWVVYSNGEFDTVDSRNDAIAYVKTASQ